MEELSRRRSGNSDAGDDKPHASPLLQQIKDLGAEFAQGATIDAQLFMMIGQIPVKQ